MWMSASGASIRAVIALLQLAQRMPVESNRIRPRKVRCSLEHAQIEMQTTEVERTGDATQGQLKHR